MKREAAVKELVCGRPKLKVPIPHHHCPGCHYGIILRLICETIEELGIEGNAIGLTGGGCSGRWVIHIDIDMSGGIHGPGTAIATAIKRIRPESLVFNVQGDGELGAIGLGSFISAALRAEKITTIFLNNGCFGTTGGQMAPTTLTGMRSATTSDGRDPALTGFPLHGAELAATIKGTAYSTRVSVHTPANRQRAKRAVRTAFQKQIERVGFSVVEFLCSCPPNWGMGPADCLKFIEEKMIAEFPLGEFKNVDSIDYSFAALR